MFSEGEKEYIDLRFENIITKLDNIINLQKIANGKLAKHEQAIQELNHWKASSEGHWKGVVLVCTIIGFAIGIISVYLWH